MSTRTSWAESAPPLPWIDNAKSLGIVAIVVGHDPAIPEGLRSFLYAFHVPLFFFASGYLLKPSRLATDYTTYLRDVARRLLVPYAFFWFVSFSLWLAFGAVRGEYRWLSGSALERQLAGLAMGTSATLDAVNGPLWFYTCLSLHFPIFFALGGLTEELFGVQDVLARGQVPPLVLPATALALCVPAIWILRRYVPWAVGIAPKDRGQWSRPAVPVLGSSRLARLLL